ncbi:MAG: DUF4340 domain-containing protein [Gemmataceae bacterium]
MNFKTTYALFGALIVILVIAAFMLLTGPKPGDEGLLLQGPAAEKLASKDFDTLTIERKGAQPESLTFTRVDDKRWKLDKPFEARVDSSAVERAVSDLLSARRDGKHDIRSGLADLGLDPPSLVVSLGRSGKTAYSVSLGNTTLGADAKVFALSSERPKTPMAIRRASLSALLKADAKDATNAGELARGIADFRSRDLLLEGAGFSPADVVREVKITDGKSTIDLAKQDSGWKFEQPANLGNADAKGDAASPEGTPLSGVEPLIKSLADIKPASAADIIDNPADFASFGLEPGKEVGPRVEIVRKGADDKSTVTETLLVGKKDDKSDQIFVRLAGEKSVAKVPAKLLEPITRTLARPVNLRDRQLLAFNPNECDGIDIKLGSDDKPLELRKVGEQATWKLFDSDASSQLANTANVRDLLSSLSGKVVKDFPEANATDAALGFDHPAAEITLWVRGILPEPKKEAAAEKEKSKDAPKEKEPAKESPPKPEEKPAAPTMPKLQSPNARLIFGKRDKDLLYVRRITKDKDGKDVKADFAVSESLLPKVTRGRIEYVDPTLPSFVNAAVQKLAFNRGNEAYLIEKQDKAPEWIIRQPADRADRAADPYRVEQVLSELAKLKVEKLWSEKPSERELERYGLKTPRLKATVTTKDGDKTQDRTYSFGVETDDKSGIYARQNERELVFIVRKDAISGLESAELQDPAVYHIDPSKVTGIKLTGWKDIVGQPTTRDLERKGPSNWALRGDASVKLNPAQCESFLKAVSDIHAEKFVAHKSGPKDEQKLTVPAGALEITIALEGEKDPVTLTIGGVDAEGKNYYAMSNKLAGDVFTLPKGIFEAVKAKPAYFAAE